MRQRPFRLLDLKLPRWVSPVALIVAVGVVTGCGPNRSPATSAGGGPPAPADKGNPTVVRIAFFPNVTHGTALVASGRGLFAKALGPNAVIEEQTFNAGPAEIEALFADQVDIGFIGPGPAVNGFIKSKGRALKIIGGAASGGASLVVRSDSGIVNIAGLGGKRVCVPQTGGTQDISLRHALRAAGLASTDHGGTVSVLPTTNADTLTLFTKHEVDAAWVPEPWVARLVKEGGGKILVDERDLWPEKRFASTVVIARTKFLAEHPDLVARILDAQVEAVAWIGAHGDEARKVIGEQIKKHAGKAIPDDILRESLRRTELTYDPLSTTVLTFADWSRELGYQKSDRGALSGIFDLGPLNAALSRAKKPAVH